MQQTEHPFEALRTSHVPLRGFQTALLTTFRRNGQSVATPVGIIIDKDKLYFATRASTGKVKRLHHNPRVTLAQCTRAGKATGPSIPASARQLVGAEAAVIETLFFGSVWGRLWLMIYRLFRPQDTWIVYEVTPGQEPA
jgi:PPOX class probable F420-dependent enzyme